MAEAGITAKAVPILNCSELQVTNAGIHKREEKLRQALAHLELGLDLLDDADAPPHIGAHLNLTICTLRDALPGALCQRAWFGRCGGVQLVA